MAVCSPPPHKRKSGGWDFPSRPKLLDKVSRGHQLTIKSCKAYFAPYRRSSSQSPMAGSPKGETRNASTRAAIHPVCSPAKKAQAASRTKTVHARPQHAPAMQERNEITATARISTRTKGAAIIFKIVRIELPPIKVCICLYRYIIPHQEGPHKDDSGCPHLWTKCPEAGAAGELDAPRQGLKLHHRRQLFEQIGQRFPQSFIVPLQRLDLLRVNTAVGVGLDRHLI